MNNKQKKSIKYHVNQIRKQMGKSVTAPELNNVTEGKYEKPSKSSKKVQRKSPTIDNPGLR